MRNFSTLLHKICGVRILKNPAYGCLPSLRRHTLCLPIDGWPGWVDLGGWHHDDPNQRAALCKKSAWSVTNDQRIQLHSVTVASAPKKQA